MNYKNCKKELRMEKISVIDKYTLHAKKQARSAFLSQIKRTVNGQEISKEQFELIIELIKKNLKLSKNDVVLDLFCGNGYLSSFLVTEVKALHGIDGSDYLIDIANEYFAKFSNISFACTDLSLLDSNTWLINYNKTCESFTKILIFGGISYLSKLNLFEFLKFLYTKFINTTRVFISPIPNSNYAQEFYKKREQTEYDINDNNSIIGCWYDPEEFLEIAQKSGWKAQIIPNDPHSYQKSYRFNVLLLR